MLFSVASVRRDILESFKHCLLARDEELFDEVPGFMVLITSELSWDWSWDCRPGHMHDRSCQVYHASTKSTLSHQNAKLPEKSKSSILRSSASDQDKDNAVQRFHDVTKRAKKQWLKHRAAQVCEIAKRDPHGFWEAFNSQKRDTWPLELAAQFEACRALMGAQPAQTPEQANLLGTSVQAADVSCLNALITSDELHD